jgi:myo-inositol-1(or 4)-monophosphatase
VTHPGASQPERVHVSAEHLLRTAADAAIAAGADLRVAFGHVKDVASKRNFHDLVTEHDAAAEASIRARLLAAVPDSTIIGEEAGLSGNGAVRWYVDPIDGTNNFVSGIPFFCVSIGVTQQDRVVAGVVYDPIRDELFTAGPGGAFCNDQPLLSRGAGRDDEAMLITGFPSYDAWPLAPPGPADHERLALMIRSFRTLRRLGSTALALAYVAAGRADVAFGISASPWDVAAGMLLVEAAGGRYRPIPATPESVDAPWLSPGYLAHVADFDPERSCMADIAAATADQIR